MDALGVQGLAATPLDFSNETTAASDTELRLNGASPDEDGVVVTKSCVGWDVLQRVAAGRRRSKHSSEPQSQEPIL